MVRMTIACARCRKLKVKCVHTGTAPCRNCSKKGPTETQECILSPPDLKPRAGRTAPVSTAIRQRRNQNQTRPSQPESASDSPLPDSHVDNQHGPHHRQGSGAGADIFANVDVNVVLSFFSVFNEKFPELRFIHMPTLTRQLRLAWDDKGHPTRQKLRLLCAAVISLCSTSESSTKSTLPSSERSADFLRQHVTVYVSPDLLTVQTLIVFAMYEWCMGHGYHAWMLAGSATRMMQSLPVLIKVSSLTAIEQEEQNRTFWSCFVLDRMIFCGQSQPFLLSMYDKEARWPSSETDYIFGSGPVAAAASATTADAAMIASPLETSQNKRRQYTKDGQREVDRDKLHGHDIDHYYGILLQGFDIWARVLKFTVNGGRRMAGMSRPENHPWAETSPWLLLYNELKAWRKSMDRRVQYPETPVEGHAAMGHAEQFGYINLIYYIAEYLPFLPTLEGEPTGPIDPPLLSVPAPAGWWADRSLDIFSSAVHIVRILSDMEDNGSSLDSPFAGFCSFSAATMNLYIKYFPSMNLGRSSGPALDAVVRDNLRYLDAFQKVRPMGAGWWMTIQHCQTLFEQANQNKTFYAGRTREDFEDLENSVYNVQGQPPGPATSSPHISMTVPPPRADILQPESAMPPPSGTPLDRGMPAVEADGPINLNQSINQIWPLWGPQVTLPFALEGLPLDYNLDMMDMYQ